MKMETASLRDLVLLMAAATADMVLAVQGREHLLTHLLCSLALISSVCAMVR